MSDQSPLENSASRTSSGAAPAATDCDLVIVGAGFAGLCMLHRARGLGVSARVFEAADGVGGTWYWNAYPGARCDVESLEYSFSFDEALQQEWHWSERYASQPEILRYANHVADRFELRRDIRFGTRVESAHFDDDTGRWTVRTDRGDVVRAVFVVMACGPLSTANLPAIPGRDTFAGATYHTGRWPHEPVDLSGKRVGVIGTGSSGVQLIPIVAREARELVVFQRTPAYCVPARNAPLDPEHEAAVKADYAGFRARNLKMPTAFGSLHPPLGDSALAVADGERQRLYRERWQVGGFAFGRTFRDLFFSPAANETAARFIRDRIAEIVRDPDTARKLMPTHPLLCKRLCVDTGYYETFNRANVRLVDVNREPIRRITPAGLVAGAVEHPLDALVFATGFDAITGTLLRIDLRGRGGVRLQDRWRDGPLNYLGLTVSGFPNLFMVVGPGSPSAFTNVIMQIEQHVGWIADCIGWMRANGRRTIEASADAEAAWVAHVDAVAAKSVLPNCNSWYLGANVPGKPRMVMALLGFPPYADRCAAVAAAGYEGFRVER
jgi:cation diffusion facilitator CzcD-associated flavoprotein CzcO